MCTHKSHMDGLMIASPAKQYEEIETVAVNVDPRGRQGDMQQNLTIWENEAKKSGFNWK